MKLAMRRNRRRIRAIRNSSSRFRRRQVPLSLCAWLIGISLLSGLFSPTVSAKLPRAKAKVVKPTVTSIDVRKRATSSSTAKNTMPVAIDILGTGFGKPPASVKVILLTNIESGESTAATVTRATETQISAHAELPTSGEIPIHGRVGLDIGDVSVNTNPFSFDLNVEKPPQPKPRSVEVDIQKESNNPQTPSQHSVLITPKDDSFAVDPTDSKAMTVHIFPPGATNLIIEPGSTPDRAVITFTAPDGFKVQDVLVTVYDSSNSGTPGTAGRRAALKQANKEVKITGVDVLSLQRRDGFGRLKIVGEGFGDYPRTDNQGTDKQGNTLTTNGDLELLCGQENRSYQVEERWDTNPNPKNTDKDSQRPLASLCQGANFTGIKTWRAGVENKLHVVLVPRNPDLRVERTLIMSADDKMIDVYFEFSHWQDYSEPFRLESASVSVTKGDPAVAPPVTSLASFPIGPQKDARLEYRYTVLDPEDASKLFGFGVGDNFYVLQLSVVNNSDKKLVVPLSSIQAEVEWSYADEKEEGGRTILYDEGPPTLSPLKLAAVTSYFDTFQKTKGKKARLFNILDGVGTLAASLVPVFGRGLERGNSIMSGGLIPGLHKAWGDLSSQQLQNLTSMSWDSVEEIPAGGSTEKFIYIQRSDQVFMNKAEKVEIRKTIRSLQGLEVSGFIVNESTPAAPTLKP